MDASARELAALVAIAASVTLAGCERARRDEPARPPTDAGAPSAATTPDARYFEVVRPLLARHGCDAGPCHGTFKGGGFFIGGGIDSVDDYRQVLAQIDRAHPAESKLLQKATGLVAHNGGQNLAEDQCDARRIRAWIGGEPDPDCATAPPAEAGASARFRREVVPALRALGCATSACHGAEPAARARLDLASLGGSGPFAAALAAFEATWQNHVVVWMSPVIKAAWGEGSRAHAPLHVDVASCAYRRLHGFVAGAPEIACDPSAPPAGPSQRDFVATVMPSLARRGCEEGSCHGGGAGDLSLFDVAGDAHAGVHDFVVLTARLEPGRPLEQTTLLRKARNLEPHGGGRRLGGEGDCRDAMLVAWASSRRVAPCVARAAPPLDRFAAEVQPVLDQMTCTRAPCHGTGVRKYKLAAHPDRPAMEANYRETLAQIDLEFTPLSEVMLRMREPCAYAVVTAWIEGTARPSCVVHDPDPALFPRLEGAHL